MTDRRDESWHLKKEINIAHFLTTIVIAISAISFLNGLDKRIETNSMNISYNKEQQARELLRSDKIRKEDQDRLQRSLDGINRKLDGIDSMSNKLDKYFGDKR